MPTKYDAETTIITIVVVTVTVTVTVTIIAVVVNGYIVTIADYIAIISLIMPSRANGFMAADGRSLLGTN